MATEELKVRFKVDASEVASGSKDAKDKVKQAADQMSSEVKSASNKMKDSFDGVAKSTEKISDASKTATSAVKGMEGQVTSSAANMEKSLDSVSKKMSAMQAFHMGARGVQMLGGMAADIASSYGNDNAADNIKLGTSVATGALQGGAIGFQMAGPIGAAAGALAGSAASLMKAGKDLQDAAKAQDQKAKDDLESRRQEIVHQRDVDKWTKDATTLATNAYGTSYEYGTDEGVAALGANISAQRKRLADLTAQRDQIALNYDPNGDVFAQAEQMRALDDAIAYAAEKLNIYTSIAEQAAEADRRRTEADEKAAQAAADSIEARKQEATAIRRRQEEADERERAKQAAAEAKAVADAQKAEEKDLQKQQREGERTLADLQSQLNGQMSRNVGGTSDALTKIGGGTGYASYNNSVEQVQKKIENSLNQLVKNQNSQNQEIINKLTELTQKEGGSIDWQPAT